MVHVTDRADVDMRLRSFEFFFSHNSALFSLLVYCLFLAANAATVDAPSGQRLGFIGADGGI